MRPGKEPMNIIRHTRCAWLAPILGLALSGCEAQRAQVDPAGERVEAPIGAVVTEAEHRKHLAATRLRASLVELSHFATRSHEGLLAIDMGTIDAHKHINGGWRSGWRVDSPQEAGGVTWFEAMDKSARVFFNHKKGGYDRVVIRMKAVNKSNKVTAYVNNQSLSTFSIGPDWVDHIIKVPAKATREGENQLLLRFTSQIKAQGRDQVAHVDAVYILPPKASLASAPRGQSVRQVDFKGTSHESLLGARPQSWTYHLQLPEGRPALTFAFGAKEAGARFRITARADTIPEETAFDLTTTASDAGKWAYGTADLSTYAGHAVALTLTLGGKWASGQLAAWGSPAISTPPFKDDAIAARAPQKAARNVLIYLIDTMRYDKFDFYNPKTSCETPHISAFARDATIFDHAYDNENWTKPSCATILTGLYPETHKTKEDGSRLPQSVTTLGEHLQSKGFKTASFIANGYVSRKFGFDQGWDHHGNYIREGRNTNVDNVVKESLAWIDRHKDARFFTYIQTIDPHVPYSPPKEWRKKYWDRGYKGPISPRSTGNQLADIKTKKMEVSDQDKRYLEALYDGEVSFNDHHFGELIAGLKARGLYDDTLIVLISDHGEEFWEHGSVGHGHSLFEEMIHSPMIVRFPGKVASGRRIPHVVSMVDLAPTLYDVLGVKPSAGLEGVGFSDTFDGVGDPHPRIAISDFLYRKKSVRVGRYKWITAGRDGALYDIYTDPGDKKDLHNKHGLGHALVRGHLGVFMGADDKSRWWRATRSASPRVEIEADMLDEIDPELQAQLEAMGYVEGAKGEDEEEEEDDPE